MEIDNTTLFQAVRRLQTFDDVYLAIENKNLVVAGLSYDSNLVSLIPIGDEKDKQGMFVSQRKLATIVNHHQGSTIKLKFNQKSIIIGEGGSASRLVKSERNWIHRSFDEDSMTFLFKLTEKRMLLAAYGGDPKADDWVRSSCIIYKSSAADSPITILSTTGVKFASTWHSVKESSLEPFEIIIPIINIQRAYKLIDDSASFFLSKDNRTVIINIDTVDDTEVYFYAPTTSEDPAKYPVRQILSDGIAVGEGEIPKISVNFFDAGQVQSTVNSVSRAGHGKKYNELANSLIIDAKGSNDTIYIVLEDEDGQLRLPLYCEITRYDKEETSFQYKVQGHILHSLIGLLKDLSVESDDDDLNFLITDRKIIIKRGDGNVFSLFQMAM